MPFLSQSCVDHGQASTDPAAVCCNGYTKWTYDAKNGVPYNGFMCWSAPCAQQGQWAGPGGVGNKCCTGLVNTGGICSVPTSGGSTSCGTYGKVALPGQPCCTGLVKDASGTCNTPPPSGGGGGLFEGIDTTMLMYAGGAILLLMMLGKK